MNYRHAFHAGNFADLVKHAALLSLISLMRRPITVVDTHAGAGRYDLAGPEARRSGEAADGVAKLMAAAARPPALEALTVAVGKQNGGGGLTVYPGSPLLAASALSGADRLIACEMRPEEHASLARLLAGRPNVETRCADGYTELTRLRAAGPALALIDPPFERADDYQRIIAAVCPWLAAGPDAIAMIWTPLKDLETFDAFLRDLRDACPREPLLVAETRMRPLTDPMRMNGCALVILRPPSGLAASLDATCGWVAQHLGAPGAQARVWSPA